MYATRQKVREDEVEVRINMTLVGPLPTGVDLLYVDYETEDGTASKSLQPMIVGKLYSCITAAHM